MITRIATVLLTLVMSSFTVPVLAEPLVFPYRAEVIVLDRSLEVRKEAIIEGFKEVLVRTAGRKVVLEHPEIQWVVLNEAQRFLLQFGYNSSDEVLFVDGELKPAKVLHLDFDGKSIRELLRSTQQSLWAPDRPKTLVWLVTDTPQAAEETPVLEFAGEPVLVSRTDSPKLDQALQKASTRRGTPLASPLLDLEDQVIAGADMLWRMEEETLRAAAQRYSADSSILIRYSQTSQGGWRGSWMIIHSDTAEFADGRAETLEQLIGQAIDTLADFYAEKYAVRAELGSNAGAVMTVDAVKSFADYRGVLDGIQRLTMVRSVHLVLTEDTQVTLMVIADGSVQKLQENLALIKRLQNQASASGMHRYMEPGSYENPLRYLWVK
ncbi:MAG: DUF2066 domain-containing protein [Cellvibrionaceae bacterium]